MFVSRSICDNLNLSNATTVMLVTVLTRHKRGIEPDLRRRSHAILVLIIPVPLITIGW